MLQHDGRGGNRLIVGRRPPHTNDLQTSAFGPGTTRLRQEAAIRVQTCSSAQHDRTGIAPYRRGYIAGFGVERAIGDRQVIDIGAARHIDQTALLGNHIALGRGQADTAAVQHQTGARDITRRQSEALIVAGHDRRQGIDQGYPGSIQDRIRSQPHLRHVGILGHWRSSDIDGAARRINRAVHCGGRSPRQHDVGCRIGGNHRPIAHRQRAGDTGIHRGDPHTTACFVIQIQARVQ